MELTDVEEALSYLVPAQRKPSRWMGLREEKFAKEFMEDVEDGTGNKMPKDLVLVLVDHWVERKRTKGLSEQARAEEGELDKERCCKTTPET